jgi:hypothetical protein
MIKTTYQRLFLYTIWEIDPFWMGNQILTLFAQQY